MILWYIYLNYFIIIKNKTHFYFAFLFQMFRQWRNKRIPSVCENLIWPITSEKDFRPKLTVFGQFGYFLNEAFIAKVDEGHNYEQ